MTSKKQIEANRRNAKKSTGPKTEEGKARSSMNALKHGLTSQRVWLNEEEKKDFHEFRLGLLDELEPWGSLETQFVCRIAAQMWRLARVPGIEAEILCKLSFDIVDEVNTGLGEAFHKDIGTYDGSLGRLARYEAILDRSLNRLLNEYRKIQADRRRREKQHAEDWRRAGLPPHDPYADYDEHDSAGLPPESLETPVKNEAIDAGEISEDFNEDTTIAARPAPATGPRNRRERRAAKKANDGGKGIDKTTARGAVRAQHAVPLQPPSV
ncbi:MAG: hypothetical protein V3S64_15560 [bacterium]